MNCCVCVLIFACIHLLSFCFLLRLNFSVGRTVCFTIHQMGSWSITWSSMWKSNINYWSNNGSVKGRGLLRKSCFKYFLWMALIFLQYLWVCTVLIVLEFFLNSIVLDFHPPSNLHFSNHDHSPLTVIDWCVLRVFHSEKETIVFILLLVMHEGLKSVNFLMV